MSSLAHAPVRSIAARYVACLRLDEILVLQGTPVLGALLALPGRGLDHLGPLAALTLANVCLVAHVFVLNDCANVAADRVDPARATRVFTAKGVTSGEMTALAAGLLVASLLILASLGRTALLLGGGIAALGALYSLPPFDWKGRPVLSSIAHLAGGILHFLLGYSLGGAIDRRGLTAALFFGLTFAAGHLTQELRDHSVDARNGIRTNAVRFGPRRTLVASFAMFSLAQAVLIALAIGGVVPRVLAAVGLLFPLKVCWFARSLADGLTSASICRLQVRYRILHAFIGLTMVTALWLA